MLKLFFWLLLVANGALLAFRMGYMDSFMSSKSEAERLSRQINVDKLKIVSASKPSALAPSASAVTSASASAPPSASAPALASAPVPVVKITPCTEVGDFVPNDTKKIEARLAELALGERLSKRTLQEVATHMVYIPPQPGKAGAEKKAGQLRELGVHDFFIVQDNSPMKWGISLGVFKSEEAAKKHLANLKKQGVRSARIGARSVTGSRVAFVLRDLDEKQLSALDKIMTDFPAQKARECGKGWPTP